MVKRLPEFDIFTAFLKNKNIIFKIRRSKVTDYAALKGCWVVFLIFFLNFNRILSKHKWRPWSDIAFSGV